MRILTFNHHESYLCSLAQTGHEFDVVVAYHGLDLSWNVRSRQVPANFNLVTFDDTIVERLRSGYYDRVICHTIKNLIWLWRYRRNRYVFIAHIPLFRLNLLQRFKSLVKRLTYLGFAATHQVRFHAVSEFKRASWRLKGDVAVLSPQALPALIAGAGYQSCVVVCNDLATRREELGAAMLERLRKKFPVTILGRNPGIENATIPKDFHDFTEILRRHRIYIYTVRYPLGDGYNTAMLEAMRLGMAIVTVDNPSSPIVHGVNGLVGRNEAELSEHISTLLNSRELVDRYGAAAQQTVEHHFNEAKFLAAWSKTLA